MVDGICPFATQVKGVTTFTPGSTTRVGFCDHTAGGFLSTMKQASFWNGAGTSVHFAIGRSGEIVQIINIFDTAHAQGRLGPTVSWPGYPMMNNQNPNLYLISTEHEDAETVNGRTRFIPGSEWTPEQYAADLRVKQWCRDEVKRVLGQDILVFGKVSLAGHHMFDSVSRAECPGKFWRDSYQEMLWKDLQGAAMPDLKNGWIHEAPFWCFYNDGFCGERRGSTDGQFPFRFSKAFGDPSKDGKWWWLRKAPQMDAGHNMAAAYWTIEEGD